MTYKDMVGKRYGRLTVMEEAGRSPAGEIMWRCRCDCGAVKDVRSRDLRSGRTKSCGCLIIERSTERLTTHGLSDHPLYHTWLDIKGRCTCPTNQSYGYYGGRGIELCDEWYDDARAFIEWSLAHGWEKGLTIDRVDVNGPYSPGNCRWVTRLVQANNMTSNHMLTYKGRTQNLSQWAKELGISRTCLSARIHAGWDLERAFTTPTRRWESVEYDGRSQSITEWAREAGISPITLTTRLNRGWPMERAMTEPVHVKNRSR